MKPQVFYPIIILLLLLVLIELFMVFDGFERARTRLKGGSTNRISRGRVARNNLFHDPNRVEIQDKEEW